jgi:hypothetical protein
VTKDGAKVDRMLYAGNNLDKAWDIFAKAVKHRPRIRLTIRQRTRCCSSSGRINGGSHQQKIPRTVGTAVGVEFCLSLGPYARAARGSGGRGAAQTGSMGRNMPCEWQVICDGRHAVLDFSKTGGQPLAEHATVQVAGGTARQIGAFCCFAKKSTEARRRRHRISSRMSGTPTIFVRAG